jgi:hypothetical protein
MNASTMKALLVLFASAAMANPTDGFCGFYEEDKCTRQVGSDTYEVDNNGVFQNVRLPAYLIFNHQANYALPSLALTLAAVLTKSSPSSPMVQMDRTGRTHKCVMSSPEMKPARVALILTTLVSTLGRAIITE